MLKGGVKVLSILSTVGGVQYRGEIMSAVRDTQYREGYHDTRGDIMSTVGDIIFCNLSTVEDIMIHMGDILSTMGVFNTMGNTIFCCLSTPTVLMISSHMYRDIPYGTPITIDDIPPRYS